jgi:hypothetical protein
MTNNQPIHKLRAGAVSLAVFANQGATKQGKPVTYNTVALQRSFKNKEGIWQHTNAFQVNDLPNALLLLQKGFEHLTFKEQNGNALQPVAANNAVYEETI